MGYCYLLLVPKHCRSQMASTLGAFPKLQDVGFYVEDLHNKYYDYPFNVNISYYGGMLHVSENTVPGLTLKTVCETFSGDTKVGARLNNNYIVITYFNARFYKLATAVSRYDICQKILATHRKSTVLVLLVLCCGACFMSSSISLV